MKLGLPCKACEWIEYRWYFWLWWRLEHKRAIAAEYCVLSWMKA